MMWALIGGHIGFLAVGFLACGVWSVALALLAIAGLMGLRVARLVMEEISESVQEMNACTWHPRSGSGPRGELSFEEEVQEIQRQNRKDGAA
jgi:MarR-like DNA-binding transcriptional regulator SgrR of sgrS sRNA